MSQKRQEAQVKHLGAFVPVELHRQLVELADRQDPSRCRGVPADSGCVGLLYR